MNGGITDSLHKDFLMKREDWWNAIRAKVLVIWYKVRIQDKVEQSRERSNAVPYASL